MDKINIQKGNLKEIDIISSKSYLHRYLIMAFITKTSTIIKNICLCEDVIETINILNNLGANYTYTEQQITLKYDNKITNDFNFYRSGSTYRFLKPVIYHLIDEPNITLGSQLQQRETSLYDHILNNYDEMQTTYEIDASHSSQYVTGLIFLSVLKKTKSTIILKNDIASYNYLLMTIEVVKKFNVEIKITDNLIEINSSKFKENPQIYIEADYSAAAFFIAHSIINKTDLIINNLHHDSVQADKKILEIFKDNLEFKFINNTLHVKYKNNKAIDCEIDDAPDLGPILITTAMFLKGTSTINKITRLKYKESNRIDSSITFLNAYKIDYNLEQDYLTITGDRTKISSNKVFSSHTDHRIVMSAAMIGLYNDVTIIDYKAVNKSFPTFFKQLKQNDIKLKYLD